MSDKIFLKDITFPIIETGENETYSFVQTDSDLETAGDAADAKKTGDEISELKADFTQLDGNLAATMITNTASGAIASFPDGADGVPVKDMTVDITPVQDLHGQSNPYPAGSGKNLLLCDTSNELKNNGNPTRSYQNGQVTIEASVVAAYYVILDVAEIVDSMVGTTYVASTDRDAGVYLGIFNPSDNSFVADSGSRLVRTIESSDVGKHIGVQFYNGTGENVTWKQCQVELGSTATAYAPYENICPISGWTGANVARTGKNLYCGTKATSISIIYGGMNNAATVIDEDYTFKPGTYRLSFEVEGTSNPSMFFSKKVNGVWSNPTNRGQVTTFTFTVPENCEHLEIWAYGGSFTALKNIQIEPGSATATAYEPSNGETVNITFPTEAGTVYGGTLDVTSGVLTVDKAIVDLGSLTWNYRESTIQYFYSPATAEQNMKEYAARTAPLICSSYLTISDGREIASVPDKSIYSASIGVDGYSICVRDAAYGSDVASFKTALNGVQLVYPLATPQTYQLTPQEVSTLLGQNNIWADCGDTTVDYRADTKLYIEQLTAPTEDDMVANTNIPDATYFMVGNNLYLSTTTIPAGDTINPGTNCTLMNLASALNALNS